MKNRFQRCLSIDSTSIELKASDLIINEADFDYLLVADGDIMQQTLNTIRQNFGSVEAYCLQYLGLSAETLTKIRTNLLD